MTPTGLVLNEQEMMSRLIEGDLIIRSWCRRLVLNPKLTAAIQAGGHISILQLSG
jgi:hypothetical protein